MRDVRGAYPLRHPPGLPYRSFHQKGQTVLPAKEPIDEEKLRTVIGETGYTVLSVEQVPYEKTPVFDPAWNLPSKHTSNKPL